MLYEHVHREAARVSCDLVRMALARHNSYLGTSCRHGGHFAHRRLAIALKALPLHRPLIS